MTPADPWSGIPADLRKLVEAYDDANRACVRAMETGAAAQYYYACERRLASEAALCAALRELVADRERLDWLEETAGAREVDDVLTEYHVTAPYGDTIREAIDAARGVTPGVAKEEAE